MRDEKITTRGGLNPAWYGPAEWARSPDFGEDKRNSRHELLT